MKIVVGNVCFIQNKEQNTVLLLERAKEPMSNKYTGVGGKTEFTEDINLSCIREVKEETGLDVSNIKLKGVIKTLLQGYDSSWILFLYVTDTFSGNLIDCDEGILAWVDKTKIYDKNIIGFIRLILPTILEENTFIEGTITHNLNGEVLSDNLHKYKYQ